jgi:pimeloyl-ACP methyl ester carboxylesterase
LIQYGHGLLGSQGEVGNSYLSEFANTYGYILFAVDWTGMKEEDRGPISLMIVEAIHHFSILPERSLQGFVEFLAAMEMMKGSMAMENALHAPDPDDPDTMIPLIDTETAYYYGNSQGAILGGAYIALSPQIERATLGVGGSPYHLLLNRSADFTPFFDLFNGMFEDPLQVQLLLALNQTIWDPGEAAGYMHMVNREPLPDTNAKDVLLQVAIADAQVTTLGAHIMARGYGAKLIEEPQREIWGLETVPSGHEGSALVEFDYGLTEPVENIPPGDEHDPHEYPRKDLAGQQQMHIFFQTGVVEHFCEGPCGESGS